MIFRKSEAPFSEKKVKVKEILGEWVLLMDTENRGRILKAEKIKDGELLVEGKTFIVDNYTPLTIEQFGKLYNLYILHHSSLAPVRLSIQQESSINPETWTLITESRLIAKLLSKRYFKLGSTANFILGFAIGLIIFGLISFLF